MNGFHLTALVLILAATSLAEETNTLPATITVDGITYSNVTWRTVTPATVSIFHQTGVASIPLAKLPLGLQQRFGYDKSKAEEYLREELTREVRDSEQQRAQAVLVAQRQAEQQREVEQQEALRKEAEAKELEIHGRPPLDQAGAGQNWFKITFTQVENVEALRDGWYRATLHNYTRAGGSVYETTGGGVPVVFTEKGRSYVEQYLQNSRMYSEQTTLLDGVPIHTDSQVLVASFGIVFARLLDPSEAVWLGIKEKNVAVLVGTTTYRGAGGPEVPTW
jgi:hypothetical protein